jgi:hypothetical protein
MQANIELYRRRVEAAEINQPMSHNARMLYESDVQTLEMLIEAERLGTGCKNSSCVNIKNGVAIKASCICEQCKAAYCLCCSYDACLTCRSTAWFEL